FYFNVPATIHIYTLSLHDALPISIKEGIAWVQKRCAMKILGLFDTKRDSCLDQAISQVREDQPDAESLAASARRVWQQIQAGEGDRKSTRLNSSHVSISYAVFCLK